MQCTLCGVSKAVQCMRRNSCGYEMWCIACSISCVVHAMRCKLRRASYAMYVVRYAVQAVRCKLWRCELCGSVHVVEAARFTWY
eukprot:7672796-Pyramimonas_sp.AAC.1